MTQACSNGSCLMPWLSGSLTNGQSSFKASTQLRLLGMRGGGTTSQRACWCVIWTIRCHRWGNLSQRFHAQAAHPALGAAAEAEVFPEEGAGAGGGGRGGG